MIRIDHLSEAELRTLAIALNRTAETGEWDIEALGCPPKAHQFKPGQSGNPKGRPKGVPSLQEALARKAARFVKVKQGEEIVKVPKIVALARRVFAKALEGDLAAARLVFQLAGEPETPAEASPKEAFALPDDDAIKRMLGRFSHLAPARGNK